MPRHTALAALALVVAAGTAAHAQTAAVPADSGRRLPAVVVTATRDTGTTLSSPLPAGVLGRDALRRDHGVGLAQTIARLPGVRALGTGEQVGKPVIRGLSGARVLVLDDGARLEDYSWSDEDGPSVDARLADRVEVIRGPASVLYGSDALGGVVNAIPAPLPVAADGARVSRGQVELYGASVNREVGTVLGWETARGRVGARVLFAGRLGQDVHTPAGAIAHTGFAAGNGEAAVALRHAPGVESSLRVAHYGGEYKLLEIDAPPGGAPAGEEGPDRITLDDRVQLAHRRRWLGLDVEARGQLQRHLLQEKADVPDPQPGQPKEDIVFDLLLNTATVDLLAHHGARGDGDGLRGTVGVSGLFQKNDSRGIVPLVPDATVSSGGAFAFERLGLGRVALLAGARGDVRHVDAAGDPRLALDGDARGWSAFTGDVGAVVRLAGALSLALNAGQAWRAPTLFELYANGPRLGEGRYEYGRASLAPERSLNLDASLRWSSPRAHGEASAFRTRVRDFIYVAPTAEQQDGLRVYRWDQARALLTGGELSASVDATDALLVHGRVDAVRGTNTGTDDPLPLMPPLRAMLGGELHARRAGGPRVGVDVERVARSSRLGSVERDAAVAEGRFPLATGAYTLVDVSAGLAVPLLHHATRIDVRVRNAGNVRYRDFLNRYKEFAYAPGRNVVVRVGTEF